MSAEKNKPAAKPKVQTREQYAIEAYKALGFTKFQANALAKVRGLSSACVREKYIRKGCSPELAYRILHS